MLGFFIPLSLVFGSKTAPVSFARYPAAFCEIIAVLFLLPATHCADDVIFIEVLEVAAAGKLCWDLLMRLCGWLMSAAKDMAPSGCFSVVGISLNLKPYPFSDPSVLITARRVSALLDILEAVLKAKVLGCGEAASLAGKLGFALCVTFGRFGRCRVKPIMRRAYSRARRLNPELLSALQWWLRFLKNFEPRPVPTCLAALPLAVSYSDGEGGLAGIGAALWHPSKQRPVAVYAEVPGVLREKWRVVSGTDGFQDIFLVEALGPLLLLLTFPKLLRNCLWIHFIDNSAAEASLIRGSSSSRLGDHVIGMTWAEIQKNVLFGLTLTEFHRKQIRLMDFRGAYSMALGKEST